MIFKRRPRAYKPARARWSTYHDHWSVTPHGSNSPNGAPTAVRHHCSHIDNDASRTHDDVLIRDHGAPEHAYFKGHDRSIHHTLAQAQQLVYVYGKHTFYLSTIADALKYNARHHVRIRGVDRPLGTEVEAKNWLPLSQARLEAIMVQLAKDAEVAYGAHWRSYVVVKVLTCLPGGLQYAFDICAAAHKATIPTMILPRGRDRLRSFRGHTEITYRR